MYLEIQFGMFILYLNSIMPNAGKVHYVIVDAKQKLPSFK